MEETQQVIEPRIRLNIKKNFKGEKGYEYTIRGETVEDIAQLKEKVKAIAESEIIAI